jgi:hypothetical protein
MRINKSGIKIVGTAEAGNSEKILAAGHKANSIPIGHSEADRGRNAL